MDPYIGKFLDDRYEILDVLGVGGMAVVYRAYCHRLNRYVAVKILKSELAKDEELRRRFHDESQSVAMLSHPNIVAVYDVSQVDGREFIVMELIEGITLKQYTIKRGGSLNWREALHFITQILQGLKHAHSRGIIHRDIKPQNVMVLRDGSVKVTDFGIARSMTSQATITQEAIGSVHYISPEQAKGSHIDARSDIYSAGVLLYELLTGCLPYQGDNPVAVALQHINSVPVPPREINPEIPIGMEQITLHAMASVPDRRYANAADMLDDLEDFRRNPDIVFEYSMLGLDPMPDEPTIIGSPVDALADSESTVRVGGERPKARFEHDDDADTELDDYTASRNSGSNKKFVIITISLVVILLALIFALWFVFFRGDTSKDDDASYVVPNLVGMTVDEAEDYIASDPEIAGHFTITEGESKESDEYEVGVIIAQTPKDGRTSREDVLDITVTLSSGTSEETVELTSFVLEDYAGSDYRDVKTQLEELGMITSFEGEYSDTVEEGNVIRTAPAAQSTVTQGDKITVYYSLGPESTEGSMMISLLGLTETDARNAISKLGLTLGSVGSEYNDDYAEGTVCYQSIPQSIEIEEGELIDIRISLGKEPVAEQDETTTTTQEENVDESSTQNEPEVEDGGVSDTLSSVKYVTVNLPEGRESASEVIISINGNTVCDQSVGVDSATYTIEFEGSIMSISVSVDGETYTNYNISDTQ